MNFKQFLQESKVNYRMGHLAPNNVDHAPLYDLTINDIYPKNFYKDKDLSLYLDDEREVISIIDQYRNKPNKEIVIYRAVPLTVYQNVYNKIDEYNKDIDYMNTHNSLPDHIDVNSFPTIKEYKKYISGELEKLSIEIDNVDRKYNRINVGDWVTIYQKYAIDHANATLNGKFKILSKTVKASELFTDGNSLIEWGYYPNK